jgi:hypothetical protein
MFIGWSLTKVGIFMWIGHPRCPPLQDKFIIRFYEETIPYLKPLNYLTTNIAGMFLGMKSNMYSTA